MSNDFDRIREALQFIDTSDRETWLCMGMAIKSELADTGFDLWKHGACKSNPSTPRMRGTYGRASGRAAR